MKRGITKIRRSPPKGGASAKKLKSNRPETELSTQTHLSVYSYGKVFFGKLEKRYKRFLTDIILEESEETITAHCANTGPLLGLLDAPSPRVMLTKSSDAKRKCPYTLEAIRLENDASDHWIAIHSALANKIVHQMLNEKMIPSLADFDTIQKEVSYGTEKRSRVDFLLKRKEGTQNFVEVKAATYSEKRGELEIGLFPDTESTRAQKHLEELIAVVQKGHQATVIFVVMGNPCTAVGPFKEKDPKFASLMKEASEIGVQFIGVGLELIVEAEDRCDIQFKQFLDVQFDV